jgi:hypothetical protein
MKKTLLIVIAIAIGIYLFINQAPPSNNEGEGFQLTDLPWQIEVDSQGNSTIFGQKLGVSTLREFQEKINQQADIKVFRNPNGSLSLEAFFKKAKLARIDSKVAIRLQLSEEALSQLESHALKRKVTAAGNYQLELPKADEEIALNAKIAVISWSPTFLRLDDKMITERFGVAAEIIETEKEVSHWLYPKLGLDIIRLPRNKATLHYISPNQFERVRKEIEAQKREADD